MDGFTKHKITHLSPSSLNDWLDNPWIWANKYLKGEKREGPAMWRGTAVEKGLEWLLRGYEYDQALNEALKIFDQRVFAYARLPLDGVSPGDRGRALFNRTDAESIVREISSALGVTRNADKDRKDVF